MTRVTGRLHEEVCAFMIISRSILLRMRNLLDNSSRENQNTNFMLKNFFPKIVSFFEIMLKNMVQSDRPQMTMWRMLIAHWITKATDKHSEYVMLITFPLQQWLRVRASMLRYTRTYIACLVQCMSSYKRTYNFSFANTL
jgi:hypothetical protein